MSTETNQENTTPETRTFTQEELDSIVRDRLSREHAKFADYETLKNKAAKFDELEEKNKTDLQKANDKAAELQKELEKLVTANKLRDIRETVAKKTGVPVDLITADTLEACEEQAKTILEFAKPNTYPNVRDGGEQTVTGKKTTAEQFADWLNQNSKERN